jgi:D-aminopeptidase
VETAVVKSGLSLFTSHCLSEPAARKVITAAALRASEQPDQIKPVPLPEALRMEIDFTLSEIPNLSALIPVVVQIGPRTVAISGQDSRQLQPNHIICSNLALAVVKDYYWTNSSRSLCDLENKLVKCVN